MEIIVFILLIMVIAIYMKLDSLEKKIEILYDEVLYQGKQKYKKPVSLDDKPIVAESNVEQEEIDFKDSQKSRQEYFPEIADNKTTKIEPIENDFVVDNEGAIEKFKKEYPLGVDTLSIAKDEAIDDEFSSVNQEVEPEATNSFLASLFSMDNILVKLGAVVLFFGLAFLAKYAIEHSFISVELRMVGLIATGLGLGFVGYKVRDKNRVYAMIMQGLGIAIIYLTIFSASKFYGLLSMQSAFALMLLVVVVGSLLALKQNSLELALFSVVGGFLVPILTSDGSNRHILLFGYYAVLNIGVLFMAYRKSWRVLNLAGFVFTFGIATAWGVLRYRAELFSTTEPFLIFYFAIYLAISILFIKNAKANPNRFIDTTLTFGLPIVTFLLQLRLVEHIEYGDAISAVVLGTIYLVLYWLFRRENRLLGASYLAIGIIFYTVAVPYYFGKQTTGMMWALEGALVIWISAKQEQFYTRLIGEFVLIVATAIYIFNTPLHFMSAIDFLGYLVVGASLIFSGYILSRVKREDAIVQYPMLGIGLFVLLVSIYSYLEQNLSSYVNSSLLSALIVGFLAFAFSKYKEWRALSISLAIFAPLGVLNIIFLVASNGINLNPMYGFNALIWIAYFVLIYAILLREREWQFVTLEHVMNLGLLLAVVTLSLHSLAYKSGFSEALVLAIWILPTVAMVALLGVDRLYGDRFIKYKKLYQNEIRGVLLIIALIWNFLANAVAINSSWYLPLFNTLELTQLAVLVLAGLYIYRNNLSFKPLAIRVLAVLSLIFITVVYARAVSVYKGIDYSFIALFNDLSFQAGLSILWASFGLGFMLLSKKYANREFWVVGFGLLVITVAKLFLVELSNSATVERIVSFIAVGALMLLIGYIVPIPPSREDERD